mgnify:FL=1
MSENPEPVLVIERDGPVALLRMNRPSALNAFNLELRKEIVRVLGELAEDDDVRAVVLAGSGRAFSAGYDISGGGNGDKKPSVAEYHKMSMGEVGHFPMAIWDFPKPIVAAVHGYAVGGGCEIAMLCDMTVAAESAKFGEPEIRFASSSTLVLPWLVPMKAAREILYSGKLITAQRAYELGMINEVVPDGDHERAAMYQAQLLSRIAPLALRLVKAGLNKTYEMAGFRNAIAFHDTLTAIIHGSETAEGVAFREVQAKEGLRAALKWRDAQFSKVDELYGNKGGSK